MRSTVKAQVYSMPRTLLVSSQHQQQTKAQDSLAELTVGSPTPLIYGGSPQGRVSVPLVHRSCLWALVTMCGNKAVCASSCLYFTAEKLTFFTRGDALIVKDCAVMVEF